MTQTCLMIMNARDIPECILSLRALKIDKVWFRGFTEGQLEKEIAAFVASSTYERYILVSDDVIVTEFALENLLGLQDSAPVVTGWSNIMPGRDSAAVELKPIVKRDFYLGVRDKMPRRAAGLVKSFYKGTAIGKALIDPFIRHHFPSLQEIWDKPPLFRTYFVGWALTSITRDRWVKHGFHYDNKGTAGHGSDQKMSLDLAADGVTILCARDSFIYHLLSVRNFIVGKVKPEVIFEGDVSMFNAQSERYDMDYIRS